MTYKEILPPLLPKFLIRSKLRAALEDGCRKMIELQKNANMAAMDDLTSIKSQFLQRDERNYKVLQLKQRIFMQSKPKIELQNQKHTYTIFYSFDIFVDIMHAL